MDTAVTIKIEKILASIDIHDPLAESILKTASVLAECFDAELHILSIFPDKAQSGAATAPIVTGTKSDVDPVLTSRDEEGLDFPQGKSKFDNIIKSAKIETTISSSNFLKGIPALDIPSYAKDLDADLITIGNHDRGFLERLLFGSISDEVKHKSTCALFIVTDEFSRGSIQSG